MLWTYHAEKLAHLREHEPRKVRRYLMDVGDEDALLQHDRQAMQDKKQA